MADTEIYRSRWIDCEDCESVTIIERRDERGVPDESEWEEFPRCLVCGGSLRHWNADEKTQDDVRVRPHHLPHARRGVAVTGPVTLDAAAVEGRVLCEAQAAACHCMKDIGHVEAGDPVHACDPRECSGQWSGSFEEVGFTVVRLPGGPIVAAPTEAANQ